MEITKEEYALGKKLIHSMNKNLKLAQYKDVEGIHYHLISSTELMAIVKDFIPITTHKHETLEELRIVVEKSSDCAKVSLKYGDKLLTSEDINSHNILISDLMLSHIRGTVCNLIVDVVNGKPEIEG